MQIIKNIITVPYTGYKKLTNWYGVRIVLIGLIIILICITAIGYKALSPEATTDTTAPVNKTVVTLSTAQAYTSGFSGSLIGTTVAKTEATLLTERGGQVTRVPVTLGQFVSAGTILAQFENSSERAALTQARGAYESALASAKQSNLSISDAQNKVADVRRAIVVTHNTAYDTVNSIVSVTIDTFFANPNTSIPGLRISGYGNTQTLVAARKKVGEQLTKWQSNTLTLTPESNLEEEIAHARATIETVRGMVDIFITNFQKEKGDSQYTIEEYRGFITSFSQIRTTLNGLLDSFSTLESSLTSAEENVVRAQLGGGTDASLASGQITQALGALQAAEANFNKTVIRSPIAGTIATLNVRAGDYVSPQSLVAKITNTSGVEVTTYINERERAYFAIGDTVQVAGVATGTVVAIAPNLDSVTKKIEMRIAVSGDRIVPGSTVTITLPDTNQAPTENALVVVPITAIKFTNTDGAVFVVEDGVLVAKPVTIGQVTGTTVTILEGIDATTEFVVDARGKTAGEPVEVISQ